MQKNVKKLLKETKIIRKTKKVLLGQSEEIFERLTKETLQAMIQKEGINCNYSKKKV